MKMPSYSEALRMGKEKLKATLVPIKVSRAQKQAELEMCKLDEKIAILESKIIDACTSEEISFPRIIDMQDELGLLERRKEQYELILEEMFPSEG